MDMNSKVFKANRTEFFVNILTDKMGQRQTIWRLCSDNGRMSLEDKRNEL